MTVSVDDLNLGLLEQIALARVNLEFTWTQVKTLILAVLNKVPKNEQYDDYLGAIMNSLESSSDAPFTLQRICELAVMLNDLTLGIPCEQYASNYGKIVYALYRTTNVTLSCTDSAVLKPQSEEPAAMDTSSY